MKKSIMRKYARLLIRKGVNIQKNQRLDIMADVETADFVALLAEEAYRAGASKVQVDWGSTALSKLGYKHRTKRSFSDVPAWVVEKAREQSEVLPARLRLVSEDPDAFAKLDQSKISYAVSVQSRKLKPYRDAMDNKHQWLVAAYPGKAWAKKVFPNVREGKAVELLGEAILKTVMCDGINDAEAAWEEKNRSFAEKCSWLNGMNFDYLHYQSSNGTDFKCELMKESMWCGGGEETLSGVYFNPNMPTEEIFTTPKAGHCEGTVVSTMPLSVRGALVNNFKIVFENGRAVEWDAEVGRETLDRLLNTDDGARMLGELALVPKDSPISNAGILYYNTLFDENASCHLALGAGYSSCVRGFESLTPEELKSLGVNDSMIHVDFMIGADDMTITGYKDGVATPIFVNGNWA